MEIGVIGMIGGIGGFGMGAAALFISWRLGRMWQRLAREAKLERLEDSQKSLKEVKEVLEKQGAEARKHFQKAGIVRFNPFSDSGGDQSFSLSLMDGHDRGFVISSLHTRQETRIYLKPVVNGKGKEFPLSKEEEQAIKIAK